MGGGAGGLTGGCLNKITYVLFWEGTKLSMHSVHLILAQCAKM